MEPLNQNVSRAFYCIKSKMVVIREESLLIYLL